MRLPRATSTGPNGLANRVKVVRAQRHQFLDLRVGSAEQRMTTGGRRQRQTRRLYTIRPSYVL